MSTDRQPFTDTQLLDAFEDGLALWTQDVLCDGEWERIWFCAYDNKTINGATVREVIAAALLDRTTSGRQH